MSELRRCSWPAGVKTVGFDKYDSKTDRWEWFRIYTTAIKLAGGDLFVMTSHLPVCMEAPGHFSINSLPRRSIRSWGELCKKFVDNFQATCDRPGSHFDLTRVKQKADEPL